MTWIDDSDFVVDDIGDIACMVDVVVDIELGFFSGTSFKWLLSDLFVGVVVVLRR